MLPKQVDVGHWTLRSSRIFQIGREKKEVAISPSQVQNCPIFPPSPLASNLYSVQQTTLDIHGTQSIEFLGRDLNARRIWAEKFIQMRNALIMNDLGTCLFFQTQH